MASGENIFQLIDNATHYNKKIQTILFSTNQKVDLSPYVLYFINHIQDIKFDSISQMQSHLNFSILESDKALTKEAVSEAIYKTTQSMNSLESKIILIKNIENGNASSLNLLLKFLENLEPNVFVIMTTNNKNKVLKTIFSRSVVVDINSKNETNILNNTLFENSKFKYFFAFLTDSAQFIESFYTQEIEDSLELSLQACNEQNYSQLINLLVQNLTKENSWILLQFLHTYYSEVLLQQNNFYREVLLINREVLSSNLDIKQAIEVTKKYKLLLSKNNVNFNAQKAQFILEMSDLYGK
ncbi:hypothetical protein ACWXVT_00080 [Mycoplasma sp. 1573]